MPGLLHRHRRLWLAIALAVVTLAVYARVRDHDFVAYDDDAYVTRNPHVRSGLSFPNARWAFTSAPVGYWHPVTWLSHQVDSQLFGLRPGPHHVGNVLLHAANAVLLFLLLHRLTRRLGPSLCVAALFALHPLHVESVAWVAERKDVLSTLFALLTLFAYVRYVERPSSGRYLAALGLFALGLMSKPMLVTLPALMLLLDHWPLDRLGSRPLLRRASIEKVPFLALSAAIAVLTIVASAEGGVTSTLDATPLSARIDNATTSYVAYLGKAVWPSGLAVFYPYPTGDVPALRILANAAALLLLTAASLFLARRRGYVVVGWLWYLVALLPVIGFVQVGGQAMADRYTYVSLIGPFLIVAFGAADLVSRLRLPGFVPVAAALGLLAACSVATSAQVKHWKDSAALFVHALEVTEGNFVVRTKYATLLHDQGRSAESLPHFEEALRLRSDLPDLHVNYGNALWALGRREEALAEYRIALDLDPRSALAHYNLGVAHAAMGENEKAIEHYTAALRADPERSEAHANLGLALIEAGQAGPAIDALESALRIDPGDVVARRGLAFALAGVGRVDAAIEEYLRVLEARPDDAWAHTRLGLLYEARAETERAVEHFRRAVELDPGSAEARARLDAARARRPPR
jgi:protein O-mannosyl-transferase